jgi:hypothetical protein
LAAVEPELWVHFFERLLEEAGRTGPGPAGNTAVPPTTFLVAGVFFVALLVREVWVRRKRHPS